MNCTIKENFSHLYKCKKFSCSMIKIDILKYYICLVFPKTTPL